MSDQKQPEPRIVEGKGGELRLEWGENPPSALARIKILANNVRGIAGDAFTYGYSAQTIGLFMGELLSLADEVAKESGSNHLSALNGTVKRLEASRDEWKAKAEELTKQLSEAEAGCNLLRAEIDGSSPEFPRWTTEDSLNYLIQTGEGQTVQVRMPLAIPRVKRGEVCRAVRACFHEKVKGCIALPEGVRLIQANAPKLEESRARAFVSREGMDYVPVQNPAEKERWPYKFITPLTKEEREQIIRDCAAPLVLPTGEFIDSKELAQLKADLAEAREEMVKQSESAKELRERLKVAESRVRTDAGLKRQAAARIEKLRAENKARGELIADLKAKANRPELFSAYLSKDNSFLVVDSATMEATVYRLDANGSLFIERPASSEAKEFEDTPFLPGTEAECVHCGSKARVAPGGKIPVCDCPEAREDRRSKKVRDSIGECVHCGSRVAFGIHGGRIPLCNCPAAREERLKEAESGELDSHKRDLETVRVLRDPGGVIDSNGILVI
ncbi:hypothetical protein [Singulisphaera sp. PoT]|uniref:hypothetical protein n=1 Tax=Singulisphaera sp. PoT TaxID=3411797 RepID=UPI003BF47190